MDNRITIQWSDACSRKHSALLDHNFGALQRPGRMMNLNPLYSTTVGSGIQAIALRGPMLKCTNRRKENIPDRPIAGLESRIAASTDARKGIPTRFKLLGHAG